MNTVSTIENKQMPDFIAYWKSLKVNNTVGIFDMDWLYAKQDNLPNPGIMEPIIKRMKEIRMRLSEVYNKEIDPIAWLAWCYYDQWHSCNTISDLLLDMGIEYKKWSLSQFTMKQCKWKMRSHTYITKQGIGVLRAFAKTREKVKWVFR